MKPFAFDQIKLIAIWIESKLITSTTNRIFKLHEHLYTYIHTCMYTHTQMSCVYVCIYVHFISTFYPFLKHNQLTTISITTINNNRKNTHTSHAYIYIRIYIYITYVCMYIFTISFHPQSHSNNPIHNYTRNNQNTITKLRFYWKVTCKMNNTIDNTYIYVCRVCVGQEKAKTLAFD